MKIHDKIEDSKSINLVCDLYENGYLCSSKFFRNLQDKEKGKKRVKTKKLPLDKVKLYLKQILEGVKERKGNLTYIKK